MELSFDPGSLAIGGVSLIFFTLGFVELLKDWFNLNGKIVTGVSAITGVAVMGVYQAIQFLPPEIVSIVESVWLSLAFGLAASGYYKLIDSRIPKRE
jgi:hypothetical protein